MSCIKANNVCGKITLFFNFEAYMYPPPSDHQCQQGRIQDVADRGAKWVINFGALEQSCKIAPSPPSRLQFGALQVVGFFLEPLRGVPSCAWMEPYSTCSLSVCFFPFLSLFSLFFSLSFPFFPLFLRPIYLPGGPRPPKAPSGYAPGQPKLWWEQIMLL